MTITMPDKFSATADLANLTVGTTYTLDSTLYEFYIDGTSSNTTLSSITWSAGSSTYTHNYTLSSSNIEGQYAIFTYLYENNVFSNFGFDYLYHEMLVTEASASDSGWIEAQNLTVGQSYSVEWWAYDNVTNKALGTNTVIFTALSLIHI